MNTEELIPILSKDYQELTPAELNVLRNATREKYHWQGQVSAETLLQSYLILKRRYCTGLETLFIEPRFSKRCGAFGGISVTSDSPLIETFDGIHKNATGNFRLRSGAWFPVVTVFYFNEETVVIGLSPEGHFFRISSKFFSFNI